MFTKKKTVAPQNPMFLPKDLKKLIVPLVIEQTLAVTVGMADTVMVSSVGEAAVSGVSLVDMINLLLISLFAALATGGAVVSAQYIGARDTEKARQSAVQLLFVSFMCAFVLATLALCFNRPLLKMIFGSVEADVMNNAVIYFMYSAISYPFLALYNACAALFRSSGNSKVSMFVSILMNVINILGNAILIFGFDMGVAGAAIATLVSRIVAALIMMYLIANPLNAIYIDFKEKFKINMSMILKILRIGVPNGLENSFFQFGKIIVIRIVTLFGTAQIAANAVANNFANVGIIPGQAMGIALITIIGQCIGAKEYEQATYYCKKVIKYTHIAMFCVNLVVALSLPVLLKVYSLSEQTKHYVFIIIIMHSICAAIFWPESFALPNALRAANDAKYTMCVSIISMIVFRIAFSYVFGLGFKLGVIGIWLAMFVDWVCRNSIFTYRFFVAKKWKKSI